jgi:hypothetical protein
VVVSLVVVRSRVLLGVVISGLPPTPRSEGVVLGSLPPPVLTISTISRRKMIPPAMAA